jgi:hypothetical protein
MRRACALLLALVTTLGAAELMGCLAIYDYSGYEKADGGSEVCDLKKEPAKSCQECITDQCAAELSECGAASTCIKWGDCFTNCCSPSCFTGCDEQFPNNPKGEDVRQCACDRCNAACVDVLPEC